VGGRLFVGVRKRTSLPPYADNIHWAEKKESGNILAVLRGAKEVPILQDHTLFLFVRAERTICQRELPMYAFLKETSTSLSLTKEGRINCSEL